MNSTSFVPRSLIRIFICTVFLIEFVYLYRVMGALLGKLTIANTPVVVSTAARSFVKDSIYQQKVVIFSKSTCPYCTMAKEQFQKLKVDYLAIELESRPDCSDVQDALKELTGARSVPRVFVDGNFIGGGTDVKKMYEDGSLAKLVATA